MISSISIALINLITMSGKSKLLTISDILEMKDLGDLLYQEEYEREIIKPDPHEEMESTITTKVRFAVDVKQPLGEHKNISMDASEDHKDTENHKDKDDVGKKPVLVEETDEYICQNPDCEYLERKDELTKLHLYEVDSYNIIVICNFCYNKNYRFCLFTHDVKPISELEKVFDNMYAQPSYNRGQLHPDIISKVNDIDLYLKGIGIENPCPTYSTINLVDPGYESENSDA